MDYKETIKERLNILSPQLRTFILNENWRRDTEKIGKQFNFDEEKYASFENEVFLVLLCFEPKNDFAENIKRELEIDSNMAGWVAEDAEKNIFNKVTNEINLMWQNEEKAEKSPQNNVGTSFEKIILNQAKAMRVAEVPSNLPTDEQQGRELPKIIHNYIASDDPYREPLQ